MLDSGCHRGPKKTGLEEFVEDIDDDERAEDARLSLDAKRPPSSAMG